MLNELILINEIEQRAKIIFLSVEHDGFLRDSVINPSSWGHFLSYPPCHDNQPACHKVSKNKEVQPFTHLHTKWTLRSHQLYYLIKDWNVGDPSQPALRNLDNKQNRAK